MTWPCKPRTKVKLAILDGYLGAWFAIIAQARFPTAVYFDGFCGPGKYSTGEFGSALIAVRHATNVCKGNSKFAPKLILNDSDPEAVRQLKNELAAIDLNRQISISFPEESFGAEVCQAASAEARSKRCPIFSFVDPFGIKDTPLDVILGLLENDRSECFINFMGGWSNRFIDHPDDKVSNHVRSLLGGDHVREVLQSKDRIETILQIYLRNLRTKARFVRSFTLFDEGNVKDNFLIFCGKNKLGFVKMKQAMWKNDPVYGSRFYERTEKTQQVGQRELFGKEPQLGSLPNEVRQRLLGKRTTIEELCDWVEEETDYLDNHLKKILTALEENGQLRISDPKNMTRRLGTWPSRLINELKGT